LIVNTNKNFEEFKLGDMSTGLYDFWKKELADVYLEATKPIMKGTDEAKKEAALNTLYICLDAALKLLHPTMPYLTEELYQRLPHAHGTASKSISIAPFPTHLINFNHE
jgi:valyl-tRNA synthetase